MPPVDDSCYDCGGTGKFCPSQPDRCAGCEDCERCHGTGIEPDKESPSRPGPKEER